MGLGKWDARRKRHLPITPYEGSWAQKMERQRQEKTHEKQELVK